MKYDKKQAIKIIVESAKEYQTKLDDKHFLILYQVGNKVKTVQVGFRSNHFLHMTGVTTNLSAQRFFERCIEGELAVSDFEMDAKGKTQRKLEVLPYMSELLYNNCMIGDFINSGICIRADYFVGNTKAVISVGFRYGKKVDYPVTLYNEDVRKLSSPTCKVLAILVKQFDEKYYKRCSYLSKGVEIEKMDLEKETKEMIQLQS